MNRNYNFILRVNKGNDPKKIILSYFDSILPVTVILVLLKAIMRGSFRRGLIENLYPGKPN